MTFISSFILDILICIIFLSIGHDIDDNTQYDTFTIAYFTGVGAYAAINIINHMLLI